MTPQALHTLIEKIISLGAEREELEMWGKIYPTLTPDQQKDLEQNLTAQLQAFESN